MGQRLVTSEGELGVMNWDVGQQVQKHAEHADYQACQAKLIPGPMW